MNENKKVTNKTNEIRHVTRRSDKYREEEIKNIKSKVKTETEKKLIDKNIEKSIEKNTNKNIDTTIINEKNKKIEPIKNKNIKLDQKELKNIKDKVIAHEHAPNRNNLKTRVHNNETKKSGEEMPRRNTKTRY